MEQYFRRKTKVSYSCERHARRITYHLVNCKYIKEYFAERDEESELKPYGIVSDDVLHGIIEVFIKVRSFSTATDYVQRQPCLKKDSKKKTLRTEVERKNDNLHQTSYEC